MRDGWITALSAQTIGTGRIMKLAINASTNQRQAQDYMQAVRSATSGAVGRTG